jgi:hypothetical protein
VCYACTFLKYCIGLQELLITSAEILEQEAVKNHPKTEVCRHVIQVLVILTESLCHDDNARARIA